jgi:phosphate transport system substrate-binding protein
MRVLGEEFRKTRPGLEVEVLPSLGSPGGIRAVLAGAIDIGVSARPLNSEELAAGAVQTPVGATPFVFAVAATSKVTALSSAELVDIYAGTKTRWPDGSPVRLVLRSPSGAEIALLYGISPQMRQAHLLAEKRPGLLSTATDQENADALESIPGAIGVISFAQLVSEKRSLHALQIDGVAPSPAALREGSYRLSVPLYLITGARLSSRAREFIAFIHSAAGTALLTRNGYHVPGETR